MDWGKVKQSAEMLKEKLGFGGTFRKTPRQNHYPARLKSCCTLFALAA